MAELIARISKLCLAGSTDLRMCAQVMEANSMQLFRRPRFTKTFGDCSNLTALDRGLEVWPSMFRNLGSRESRTLEHPSSISQLLQRCRLFGRRYLFYFLELEGRLCRFRRSRGNSQ